MKDTASTRIINAIIYGGSDVFTPDGEFIPKKHPLYKSLCPDCGMWVSERDKQAHTEVPEQEHQRELPPREQQDEEDRSQSEREAYHIAH